MSSILGRYRCMIYANEHRTLEQLEAEYERVLDCEPVPTDGNLKAYGSALATLRHLIDEQRRC